MVEDDVNGILVKPGSAVEISRALERLLCSPDIRKRIGKAGRAIYDRKFTMARMMAQIQELYDWEMKRRDHEA